MEEPMKEAEQACEVTEPGQIPEPKVTRRKLFLPSEPVYLFALAVLALAVSMTAAADFGVSMIVAPAYLFSIKIPALTFGQSEYVLQGVLFVLFCLLMRRFRPIYLVSFVTCLLYGLILDGWRLWIPLLNPAVTEPGSMHIAIRILLLFGGMTLTSFSIALLFNVYIYPQVYDFFVKGLAERYRLNRSHFKTGFDFTCLAVSIILSYAFFGKLVGVGFGTILMTLLNGVLIGLFDRLFTRFFDIRPLFPKLAKKFDV